jgi:hypothetical protein
MAQATRVHAPILNAHLQTCLLHGSEKKATCSGTWKRKGGDCSNKATGPLEPGMMPLCRIHKDQLKQSAWCRALLPCGFECGRICAWKPHGFQLCSEHYEHPMTCYLLKIPIEIRLRIYGLLLPDKPIPARYTNSRCLTSDNGLVYTAFIRTNHQIHDEAVHLLYAVRAFTIELAADRLAMCNSSKKAANGNHALQDYQMQLMLLEQQNKKRLMMARQEQDNMMNNGSSSSSHRFTIDVTKPPTGFPIAGIPYTRGPAEPAWSPPLSVNYFNMIQSFFVEIIFPPPSGPNSLGHSPRRSPEAEAKALELKLYDYCDHLHKLIGRFRLMQRPLARLEVVLKFGKSEMKRDETISAAQVLLRPFQRLRMVGNLAVPLILVNDFEDREVELLNRPECAMSVADRNFYDYLNCWLSDLSSSGPLLGSPVFKAYWQLERLLSSIKNHHSDAKFFRFTELLYTARVARETDDLLSFRAVWNLVVHIWFDYVNDQRQFRTNVSLSIDAIESTIEEDIEEGS